MGVERTCAVLWLALVVYGTVVVGLCTLVQGLISTRESKIWVSHIGTTQLSQ